jgi:hypothetical protein
MNLNELEKIHAAHRNDLEMRRKTSMNNLENLDRMAQELFQGIAKRVEADIARIRQRSDEDREAYAAVFIALCANEEANIRLLNEQLGASEPQPDTALIVQTEPTSSRPRLSKRRAKEEYLSDNEHSPAGGG